MESGDSAGAGRFVRGQLIGHGAGSVTQPGCARGLEEVGASEGVVRSEARAVVCASDEAASGALAPRFARAPLPALGRFRLRRLGLLGSLALKPLSGCVFWGGREPLAPPGSTRCGWSHKSGIGSLRCRAGGWPQVSKTTRSCRWGESDAISSQARLGCGVPARPGFQGSRRAPGREGTRMLAFPARRRLGLLTG